MWPDRPAAFVAAKAGLLGSGAVHGFTASGDTIARGIRIVGDIKGAGDLSIAGAVIGSVFLPRSRVQVHAGAEVHANITARIIEVDGRVVGDLRATERVVITSSSTVEGDIVSPQIRLQEGCLFRGSVQMNTPDIKVQPPREPRANRGENAVDVRVATA